ncbi:MAG: hypothetical protein HY782_02095 [Chloroflexi bacterium]|nr:hypothetical protein [Chloroflexota bacterium]
MGGRFEICETTKYADAMGGWHEVTIRDRVTGASAKAVAKSYAEAELEAWHKLKEVQIAASSVAG